MHRRHLSAEHRLRGSMPLITDNEKFVSLSDAFPDALISWLIKPPKNARSVVATARIRSSVPMT
jgi:hypothetical protein